MSTLSELIQSVSTAPSFFNKDSEVGAYLSGDIVSTAVQVVRDFNTNKTMTWEDGTEALQIRLVIHDKDLENEEEQDNGQRAVYVKFWGNSRKAFAKAAVAAGMEEPLPGDFATVTYARDEPNKNKAFNDTKIYEFEFTKAR